MDITPAVPESRNMVDSYGPGRFRIRGEAYQGSILLFAGRVLPWSVESVDALDVAALQEIRDADPPVEVLLLGTGARMELVPSVLRRDIRQAGIAMDIMDTGAACRTFNVLMVEGRRAAAALIAA